MIRFFTTVCIALMAAFIPAHAAMTYTEIIPAPDSKVASLSTITVLWSAEWLEDVASGQCGRVEDESGNQVATITCEEDYGYENAACNLILSETITTPGQYTVYVDADAAFDEDEEGNEAFSIKYEVVSATETSIELVSADPENNSTVTSLSKIETVWSYSISVINSDEAGEVVDENGDKVCDLTASMGVFSTDPITFTLSKTISDPGFYTVNIPAGLFETEDGVKSAECTLSYTVEEVPETPLLPTEIDPEDNSVMGHLNKFTIAWNADFDFGYEAEEVGRVTDENNITVATINCEADWMDTNVIEFTLSQPVIEAGTYTVTIEAGKIVAADNTKNEEITLTYTVDPSLVEVDLTYWVIPAGEDKFTDETFPNIEFVFSEEIELKITEFEFESADNEKVEVTATLSYDKETVTFDCSTITNSGVWTLTIPEGAFKSSTTGNINPANSYTWEYEKVTVGIGNIVDENHELFISEGRVVVKGYDEVSIYDLKGNNVAHYRGNVSDTLQPGLYLIQCMEGNKKTAYKVIVK